MTSLHNVLNNSYLDKDARAKMIGNYAYDYHLSNDEDAVYHNPIENKLLITFKGTSNIKDLGTDANLAIGNLRNTARYKRSNDTYRNAKNKYSGSNTIIAGHSLAGSLASAIGDDNDTIYTYNKGSTIFGNSTKTKKNEHSYRQQGDIVSVLDTKGNTFKNKNTLKTLINPWWKTAMESHTINHLNDKNIYI